MSSKIRFCKLFQTLIKIKSLNSAGNQFKRLLLCCSSFLLVVNGQERSGFLEIWPKMAEKWAKYAKIKVFDTLIKIESLVLAGNDF